MENKEKNTPSNSYKAALFPVDYYSENKSDYKYKWRPWLYWCPFCLRFPYLPIGLVLSHGWKMLWKNGSLFVVSLHWPFSFFWWTLKVIFYFAFRFLKLFLFGRGRTYRTPGAARGRGQVKVFFFFLKKKKEGGENIIIRQGSWGRHNKVVGKKFFLFFFCVFGFWRATLKSAEAWNFLFVVIVSRPLQFSIDSFFSFYKKVKKKKKKKKNRFLDENRKPQLSLWYMNL